MLILFAGCSLSPENATKSSEIHVEDVRFDVPAAPERGFQWVMPDIEVPAFADQHTCIAGTYDGPDIGANQIETYQADGYGHHLLVWTGEVDPDLYPDGAAFDCADPSTMSGWLPIFIVHPDRSESGAVIASAMLPEGMGISLESGTRTITQVHYLNASDHAIRTRDVVNVTSIPAEDVATWAAPWGDGLTDMPLTPGEATTLTFDCAWPKAVSLLTLFGHMHQHGSSFSVDHLAGDSSVRLMDIPEWDPTYRDTPPLTEWEMPGLPVAAGDVFRTSCTFYNDDDHELNYPDEMCASAGIAYPSKTPMFCNPSD